MSGTRANRFTGIAWHRNRLITGREPGVKVRARRKNKLNWAMFPLKLRIAFRGIKNVRIMRAPK